MTSRPVGQEGHCVLVVDGKSKSKRKHIAF